MSEHPIDVLRKLTRHASSCPVGVLRGWDCTCGRDAALRAVEQLEADMREIKRAAAVGIAQTNRLPDVVGILATARTALAPFDRKEQTP